MSAEKQFTVIDLLDLSWPASLKVPAKRFRLFIAADTIETPVDAISEFAKSALASGMVYCCAWGRGCERFHDIVDECITVDDITERAFAGPNEKDVVMTTWHDHDSLEEALDFFCTGAVPTDGFSEDSGFRVVISVRHPDWAAAATHFLDTADFFI